jgi:diguanylate cyclase (GGDEF)-like protein
MAPASRAARMDAVHRDGSSLSLALIDVDNFKRVNDEAGHRTGDRALKHVVSILREASEPARAWCGSAARNSCCS